MRAGRALRDDAVVLGEDRAAVGQNLEPVEVVGREHDRLPGHAELHDELDEPLLGAGVEGRGGFVEEQHFGVHDEHRRDRDPLLLPARQLVRRAVGELDDVEHRERVVDARVDLVARSSPCSAGRTRSPPAPSARTPARRSSGTRNRRASGTRARTARLRGSPRSRRGRTRGRSRCRGTRVRRAPSAASTCRSRSRRRAPASRPGAP